jgi:3-oxoacyl-[acyl-carrier protein] reductase
MRKVAFITGASGDIGSEISRILAKQGYAAALGFNTNESAANELSAELKSQGCEAIAVKCDITDSASIASALELIKKELGEVMLLVNNAGLASIGLYTDLTDAELANIITTDLVGAMEVSRQVLPAMIRSKQGCIINISSVWGEKGASCEVAYSAAKAGLIGFTKALAKEVGPSGVRVNAVSPGVIMTDMMADFTAQDIAALKEETPLNTLGTPEDIAEAVLYLASDRARFITGHVMSVNGGFI